MFGRNRLFLLLRENKKPQNNDYKDRTEKNR
jgi:hypothetical protein